MVDPRTYKVHCDRQMAADLLGKAAKEAEAEHTRLEELRRQTEAKVKEMALLERAARKEEKERLKNSGIEERANAAIREIKRTEREQAELLTHTPWSLPSPPSPRKVPRFRVDYERI
jgi:hypothetical protein